MSCLDFRLGARHFRRRIPGLLLVLAASFASAAPSAVAAEAERLPGSAPLEVRTDWPDMLMDGAHRFLDKRIAESVNSRARFWSQSEPARAAGQTQSTSARRHDLARLIGVVDPRTPPSMERYGDDQNPALVAETGRYRVFQVRWPVLGDISPVYGEGLLLVPREKTRGYVVAIPDADWTPEDICGLTRKLPKDTQYARRLAENGFEIVVPTLVSRDSTYSGNPNIRMTKKPHREWIYHMAYHMGRHVIGYEVQRVLSAVDWFQERHAQDEGKIGVVGCGEGALIAFYAAAIDPRIDAALVSGYFQRREGVWREPIYRNVWGLLAEFGDAEIAALIAPRGLVIEHSSPPEHPGVPVPSRPGELAANVGLAAGGEILTPKWESVSAEFARIDTLLPAGVQPRHLIHGPEGATVPCGSVEALQAFAKLLGVKSPMALSDELPTDRRRAFDPDARERRTVKELENHVQWLLRTADARRDEFMLQRLDLKSVAAYSRSVEAGGFRRQFWNEVLGKIDDPLLPPRPRSRKLYDRPKWTGYEVVLDVLPDVIDYGVLLLPKDFKPGERRPVVVCQHGRNGVPRDVIEGDSPFYHNFAARLADQGFIVFAPHNLYRTEQRYRWLQRKANSVKLSMFSIILVQHEQILRWLATLDHVDPRRIAFYGLSYGGETAVRVPPLLDGYCLSICSADFNDWARRVADAHSRYGYPFYDEWEMPYFNMGNQFNYAELAYLMAPRPFMVERGHNDGVGPDEWVAYEFAKVRRLYDRLGIGERAKIEFFNGPHTIHGQGTFAFLHEQLGWPAPREAAAKIAGAKIAGPEMAAAKTAGKPAR